MEPKKKLPFYNSSSFLTTSRSDVLSHNKFGNYYAHRNPRIWNVWYFALSWFRLIKFNGKKVISSFFHILTSCLEYGCIVSFFVFINLENCYIALKKGVYLFPLKYRQQQYFISPHNYYKRKNIYLYIQQIIGVLAARNNLKVKNARQPVALNWKKLESADG